MPHSTHFSTFKDSDLHLLRYSLSWAITELAKKHLAFLTTSNCTYSDENDRARMVENELFDTLQLSRHIDSEFEHRKQMKAQPPHLDPSVMGLPVV